MIVGPLHPLAMRILKMAEQERLDSVDVALALADVLGSIAAMVELRGPVSCSFDERMVTFTDHVRARHKAVEQAMVLVQR